MLIDAKIYNDGSHYIAIPKTVAPVKEKKKRIVDESLFEIKSEEDKKIEEVLEETGFIEVTDEPLPFEVKEDKEKVKEKKKQTGSELKSAFDKAYVESMSMARAERRNYLIDQVRSFFFDSESCVNYVNKKLDKINRNNIIRRMRFCRKAYMHDFNYFVTFTYDGAKHTEESFKKKLSNTLRNFHTLHGWCYMGVWERSKASRLHFHGLFKIPKGEMVGELFQKRDYNVNSHQMQVTTQNTFFNEKFGRSDFEEINKEYMRIGNVLAYILKYISKTGEKLVYSRGIPMYVRSDIADEDIIAEMKTTEYTVLKYVLADDFTCMDEGEILGTINEDGVKELMKTANA